MDYNTFIAVDMGNTTCEFVVFDSNIIKKRFFIPSKPLLLDSLLTNKEVEKLFRGALFIISSVVKENNEYLKDFLFSQYAAKVVILNHLEHDLCFKNRTRDIASIGMDIICKSAYIAEHKLFPALVFDVGTASVLQYIDNTAYTDKVAITLGLSTLYKVLNSSTSLLPLIEPRRVEFVLGTDTVSAMEAGVYWGYLGTVHSLVEKAMNEYSCDNIFITGGLASLILEDLKFSYTYDSEIIFKGIKTIVDKNNNRF